MKYSISLPRYLCAGLSTISLILGANLAYPAEVLSLDANSGTVLKKEEWDVANPPGEKSSVQIEVNQGTWMSLDVSPDSQTIAFDLLGDIYTLPITGGTATNISSGIPWEFQPRFSPDGSKIAFTSDRAGGENIWVMNTDGSESRQVTKESFRLLNNPAWHPSGQYLAARKHFTTKRSLGTGEIWLYHIDGGDGIKLVKRPDEKHQKELGEPIYSPDGKRIYYSLDVTPGGNFKYAQDSNSELFQIRAYNTLTGKIETVVSGPGGAVRPTPSPDGNYLAFVRRVRAKSALFLLDLRSGEIKQHYANLDQDVQEVWATQGLYPNMDWTPDSQHLLFWSEGKIRKLNIASTEVTVIPFNIKDQRQVLSSPRPPISVGADNFNTRLPRFAQLNPSGNQMVFESLGKIWVKALTDKPIPITGTDNKIPGLASQPSWSRDGKWITFVNWSDDELGSVYKIKPSGRGLKKLTQEPGHYANPRFSNQGDTIVFSRLKGGYLTSPDWSRNPGIYVIGSRGGPATLVTEDGENAQFDKTDKRIYMTLDQDDKHVLASADLDGQRLRRHAVSSYATKFSLSPRGDYLVFKENYNLYLVPLPSSAEAVEINPEMKSLPLIKISTDGGDFPSWSNDDTFNWSSGPEFYAVSIDELTATNPVTTLQKPAVATDSASEEEKRPAPQWQSFDNLSMSIKTDKPSGLVALTHARIVTMSDAEGGIIEDGTILIEDNRIKAVGTDIVIPSDAKQVDLTGKTITPGFIDAHAHGPHGAGNIIPQRNWASHGTLAFGVTTTHNPSSNSAQIFPAAEMQKAGIILAPRTYSSGEIVYGAKSEYLASIDNYADALSHIKRLKNRGAISIKNYNQPRRDQRQQVATAARAENIMVVAEGGALFHMDLSLVIDGQTGIEHNLPQWAIYEDVLQLWSQTRVGYTPTFVVSYNGPSAERYWYQETEVWKHPLLSLHVPPHVLQPASVRRIKAPISDYAHIASAKIANQLAKRGVSVHLGAHGQREGLAAHWEMWSLAQGGMSPIEVLNAATLQAAKHLGMAQDIGSIEPGKLADLVILDADITQDIFRSDQVYQVMLNGRLYDAKTLNEVVTGDWTNPAYYWE